MEKIKKTFPKYSNREKGITLVALVITIVILIILATIAIQFAFGENGLINRAQESKEITEIAQWDERIEMAIAAKTMEKQNLTIDDIIQELIDEDIIDNASQVNKENGNITTNKPSYVISDKLKDYISNVKITISKTPETELSGVVLLKVEKVEGLKPIDLNSLDITSLNETQKKELIKIILVVVLNHSEGTDFEDFEDYLQDEGITEPEFWEDFGDIDEALSEEKIEALINEGIQYVNSYTIINPENKESNKFLTLINGNYEFKVKEILTGKTYTETVEVNEGYDKNDDFVVQEIGEYKTETGLVDKSGKNVDFEYAYILYKGEKINITECIMNEQDYSYLSHYSIGSYLENIGVLEHYLTINGTVQKVILIKDNKAFLGEMKFNLPM